MPANTYGRQVVIPLANKSGGGVIAGDVVIVDTSNNDAFTTTTSAGFTGGVGIAMETIANNATGRVLISGYAALVNVNASVTRGQYGKTHTVAKQATGTSARGTGTFCQWLTGGTTPDALVYPVDLLGSSLTNPMTGIGAIIQGTTAGAPVELAAPLAGKVLTGAGVTTPVVYAYPPGYELDYAQITSNVNQTATTEGTGNTVVTGASVTYDGAPVMVEFMSSQVNPSGNNTLTFVLVDAGTAIGWLGVINTSAGIYMPVCLKRRFTPSAGAHTYGIEVFGGASGGTVFAGAGGAGVNMPAYMRITKV